MSAELEALDAEYRKVARRFRENGHESDDLQRLREIRKQIKVLVEAEIKNEYKGGRRSGAARSSRRRRERRHRSAPWQLDHEVRECEGCGVTFQPTDSRQFYCTPSAVLNTAVTVTPTPYPGGSTKVDMTYTPRLLKWRVP